jgi:hypothetical protein
MHSTLVWADEEFGQAELGDARRTRRLVALAAEAASRPSGIVSKACASSASREGAFRLLENPCVHPHAVAKQVFERTVERCRGESLVFVPIDGSSLTLSDEARTKEVGDVGANNRSARGIQAMTALAVSSDGAPVGICGQTLWNRQPRSEKAPAAQGESAYWLEVLRDTHQRFSERAPHSRPWFQMDRGADFWPVFELALELDALLTVRAVYNRPLADGCHLWSKLARAPIVAKRGIELNAKPATQRKRRINGKRVSYFTRPREPRRAVVTIRAISIELDLSTKTGAPKSLPINAVLVREERRGEDRVEWLLLTTHPIRSRRDVLAVVRGYTLRWRIEDFHRAWKRGLCRVEDMQLQSRGAIFKWATILAAVATRAMRLTHLARQTPDALATTEFSKPELQALIALRQPKGVDDDIITTLELGQAVRWVAEVGGYTGPWNGPPGATVIGRGLHDLLVTARAFEYRDKKR